VQVEMNPVWKQRRLRDYCAEKGIHVTAYSPLGGQNWSGEGNAVLDSEVLADIAKARGKSLAQVHQHTTKSLNYRLPLQVATHAECQVIRV
jgi:diketogulonate reductase-like aldo/keto reductase